MVQPDAVYDAYRKVLAEEASKPPAEWTFKSNPAYRQILEHVSPEQGHEYLALAQSSPRWSARMRVLVAETALENDRLGKPVVAPFDSLGISCSPTNMRYLWHAFQILDWLAALELKRVNVVEIGGGYGGLALWLHRLASGRISHYAILDLHEAGTIQAAYAEFFGLRLTVADPSYADAILPWPPFLISAYAFSELSAEWREWYEQAIVRHCLHGWLLWNMIPVYPFTSHLYEVADEVPLTGTGNKVVRF